jgi:hypothetical protein
MSSLGFRKRLFRRLDYWADWRCVEPVVVFESDDWGMERRACSQLLRAYGEPSEWADEELETAEDLTRLYEVLEHYQDEYDRPACFTANFVVANPDYDAIAASDFTSYADIPIGQKNELRGGWLDGLRRRVFAPQYHGRSHFWPEAWLSDLRSQVAGARALFDGRCHGGLSLLKGQGWRYHSEYMDWNTGEERSSDALLRWLKEGLDFFREMFGFFPRSTIASHYILTPSMARAWRVAGGEFVQGTNYRILRGADSQVQILSHSLGESSPEGLLMLGRTVKFDPRPQRPLHGADAALQRITECFRNNVPAIIDTHRINFTGAWRDSSLQALDDLLKGLKPYRPRFLSSVEIGEAIGNSGKYRDAWTGETRHLTPLNQPWRRILRRRIELSHGKLFTENSQTIDAR